MLSKQQRQLIINSWHRLHRKPSYIFGLYGTIFFILLALYPNWLLEPQSQALMLPPSWHLGGNLQHLLGTDQHGQDIFSALILGIRSSFGLSLILTLVITASSLVISIWCCFNQGYLTKILFFLLRCISVIPSLLMAIIITLLWGKSLLHATLSIALVIFPIAIFRISQKLQLEQSKPYILNAYLNGASPPYIIFKLLLPNSIQDIIEEFITLFSMVLLEITVLAFFNLSGSIALCEWGSLLREASQLMQSSLLPIIYPGILLILSLLCIQLLGKSIIDATRIKDE